MKDFPDKFRASLHCNSQKNLTLLCFGLVESQKHLLNEKSFSEGQSFVGPFILIAARSFTFWSASLYVALREKNQCIIDLRPSWLTTGRKKSL